GPRRPAAAPSNASRTFISRRPSRDHVTTAAPPLNAARILVVDDELGPRESLRMLLKPVYQIQTADGGRAALEQIPSYRPDVVILDIKMPELDGLEVLRRVKRIDPAIEVVMITAYASLETVKLALTHGALEYLIKPFSRQDLEDVVRAAPLRRGAPGGGGGRAARRQGGRGGAAGGGRAVPAGHPAVHRARDLAHHRGTARQQCGDR